MSVKASENDLVDVIALLSARRLGLGSVLGYLFGAPRSIFYISELGGIVFLFVIRLEMKPSYL